MPKKTFTLRPVGDSEDPVIVELSYKVKKGTKMVPHTDEYLCFDDMPAQAARYLNIDSAALASIGFIQRCIQKDGDEMRFLELTVRKDVLITREDLADVVEWLTETYSDRPTKPPAQ